MSRPRNIGIDYARVGAAIGIVWIHGTTVDWSRAFGRYAIPFLTIIGAYLAARSAFDARHLSLSNYIQRRTARLLVPFYAWSGIYFIFKFLIAFLFNQPAPKLTFALVFLRGGEYHLWFFPFILFASMMAYVFCAAFSNSSVHIRKMIGLGLLSVSTAITLWLDLVAHFRANLSVWGGLQMWIDAMPAAIVGIGLAFLTTGEFSKHTRGSLFKILAAIVSVVSLVGLGIAPDMEHCLGLTAAVSMTFLALMQTNIGPPLPSYLPLAELALGIYLMHPAVFKLAKLIAPSIHPSISASIGLVSLNIAICYAITLGLRATRMRWLIQ